MSSGSLNRDIKVEKRKHRSSEERTYGEGVKHGHIQVFTYSHLFSLSFSHYWSCLKTGPARPGHINFVIKTQTKIATLAMITQRRQTYASDVDFDSFTFFSVNFDAKNSEGKSSA